MQNGNKTQINAKQQTGVKKKPKAINNWKPAIRIKQEMNTNQNWSEITNSGRAQKDKTEGGAGTEVWT